MHAWIYICVWKYISEIIFSQCTIHRCLAFCRRLPGLGEPFNSKHHELQQVKDGPKFIKSTIYLP